MNLMAGELSRQIREEGLDTFTSSIIDHPYVRKTLPKTSLFYPLIRTLLENLADVLSG